MKVSLCGLSLWNLKLYVNLAGLHICKDRSILNNINDTLQCPLNWTGVLVALTIQTCQN